MRKQEVGFLGRPLKNIPNNIRRNVSEHFMTYFVILVLLGASFLGLYFLGGSITGFVIIGGVGEDFETGNLNDWTLTHTGVAADWQVVTTDPSSGTYHSQSNPQEAGELSSMERIISTSGYENINFSYKRKLLGLDTVDWFRSKWYDGSIWYTLEEINSANDGSYVYKQYLLPASADDNVNFAIKFECVAGAVSEFCRVDDVNIDGDVMDDEAPNLLIISPGNGSISNDVFLDVNYMVGSDAQACWYSNDSMSLNNSIICGQNITDITWTEGLHNVKVWANDSNNNLNSSLVSFTIDSVAPYFEDNTPIDQELSYGDSLNYDINASDSLQFGCFSVNDSKFTISCDGLLENINPLGVGGYYLNIIINDSIGNLNSTIILVNVTKKDPSSNMQVVITPSNNEDYGTQTSSTASETNNGDADVVYNFYRNNQTIANPNTQSLGVGTYYYVYNTTGGQNYTSGTISDNLIINQINSEVNLNLNGSSENISIYQGDTISLNCSMVTGDLEAQIQLYKNNILINSGTSPLGNLTSFNDVQVENITCIYLDSQNYTSSYETFFVEVTSAPDVLGPSILIDSPIEAVYFSNESLELNFSVSDGSGIDSCWYNINGGVNISLAGCANTSFDVSGEGNYVLNLFSIDSLGNPSNSSVSFNVDLIGVSVSVSEPTGTKTSRESIPITYTVTGNSLTCWYEVRTSIGGEVISNTSLINCSDSSFDVAADGDYILYLYLNNSLGSFTSDNSSFSVDTSSSSSSSGGSSGGGGGGSIITSSIVKVELGALPSLIVNPGDSKKINLNVKNTGTKFLNDCKLRGDGQFSSWVIYSGEKKNLAAGEEFDFTFDLKIPENFETGTYSLTTSLECKEKNESSSFSVEIIEKRLGFELLNVDRIDDSNVKVIYSLEELSGIEQDVELQFLLYDLNNEKAAELSEGVFVGPNSKSEFEIIIPIDESLAGELSLLINLNSETYSGFVEESIILGAPTSGFAILGGEGTTDNIVSVAILILFIVFAIFIVKRIFGHRKKIKRPRKKRRKFSFLRKRYRF